MRGHGQHPCTTFASPSAASPSPRLIGGGPFATDRVGDLADAIRAMIQPGCRGLVAAAHCRTPTPTASCAHIIRARNGSPPAALTWLAFQRLNYLRLGRQNTVFRIPSRQEAGWSATMGGGNEPTPVRGAPSIAASYFDIFGVSAGAGAHLPISRRGPPRGSEHRSWLREPCAVARTLRIVMPRSIGPQHPGRWRSHKHRDWRPSVKAARSISPPRPQIWSPLAFPALGHDA
jgi:hypothetical protein